MKTYLHFTFLLFINILIAQEIKTEFISKTPLQADTLIGVDEFKNIYFIKNNVLFKKSTKNTINYSNVQLGQITSVNIQNPFKLVIFYKEFNSVILLDNNLNELTNRIDLTKETRFNNVQFVSGSSENDLWIFSDDTKLYLYDYKKHSLKVETQPMNFYHDGFNPNLIKSTYKNVWLLSKKGILKFNEYGNFIQFYGIDNVSNIFPLRKNFIYYKDNSLYYLENTKTFLINLEYNKLIINIHIYNNSIHIFDGKEIYQYRINY